MINNSYHSFQESGGRFLNCLFGPIIERIREMDNQKTRSEYRGSTAGRLVPNDNSARWQQPQPRYFGFTIIQWEEALKCRPFVLQSTTLLIHTFSWTHKEQRIFTFQKPHNDWDLSWTINLKDDLLMKMITSSLSVHSFIMQLLKGPPEAVCMQLSAVTGWLTLSSTTSLIGGSPSGFCMQAGMNWKPSRKSLLYWRFPPDSVRSAPSRSVWDGKKGTKMQIKTIEVKAKLASKIRDSWTENTKPSWCCSHKPASVSNLRCPVELLWSSPCLRGWLHCRCSLSPKYGLHRSSWAPSRSHHSPRGLPAFHPPRGCWQELEWRGRRRLAVRAPDCCSEEPTVGPGLQQADPPAWTRPVRRHDSAVRPPNNYYHIIESDLLLNKAVNFQIG